MQTERVSLVHALAAGNRLPMPRQLSSALQAPKLTWRYFCLFNSQNWNTMSQSTFYLLTILYIGNFFHCIDMIPKNSTMKITHGKDLFKIKYTGSIIISFHSNIEKNHRKTTSYWCVWGLQLKPMVLTISFD